MLTLSVYNSWVEARGFDPQPYTSPTSELQHSVAPVLFGVAISDEAALQLLTRHHPPQATTTAGAWLWE